MKKKFAILLALFLIAVVCSAGCIDPEDPVDPIDPVDPVDPVDPITPVDPVDPVVPTEEYSVMFMLNYGDAGAYTAETVKAGETVSKPASPTRSGYTFNGWFTAAEGGAAYDFTQPVNADVTLYAQWKKKSSSSSGGSSAPSTPSHTHSWGEWVETTAPTCTEAGEETRECSTCDDVETRAVGATGHQKIGDRTWTTTKAASCFVAGEKIAVCAVCGEDQQIAEVEKLQHDLVAETPVDATCAKEGYTSYTCSHGCGTTEKRDIMPATGAHTWDSGTSSCGGTKYTCSVCGEVKVDGSAVQHQTANQYTQDPTNHWKICTACSAIVVAKEAHDFDANGNCSVCEYQCVHDYAVTAVDETLSPAVATLMCSLCNNVTTKDYVAKVGTTYYETLDEAITAAGTTGTLVLLDNVDSEKAISEAVTINVNGKTAKFSYDNVDNIKILATDVTGLTVTLNEKTVVFGEKIGTDNLLPVIVAYTKVDTCYSTIDIYTEEGLMWTSTISKDGMGTSEGRGCTINIMTNLDMTGLDYYPINSMWITIDGNGKIISNLDCLRDNYVGRSGFLAYAGACTIKDLTLHNVKATGTQVGAFAGSAEALILENCKLTGTVELTWEQNPEGSAYQETWNGIGAVAGVSTSSAGKYGVVLDGAQVTIKMNGMTTEAPKVASFPIVGYIENANLVVANVLKNDAKITVIYADGFQSIHTATETSYEVSSAEGLGAFRDTVNAGDTYSGKTVKLTADIDLKNEAWIPIGGESYIDSADNKKKTRSFQGIFDGQENTISNLYINMPNSWNVGIFGYTTNGEIKNLIIENADVTGYCCVGAVAGTPYTSKYTNIELTGHVEIKGMSYVGGVGGKNAYANWEDITVNVDETSYVNANSIEGTTAYRTYIGGVVGFMGEGGHTFTDVKSNIDVIGTTCDVGGIVGIAHYGNTFINCECTGDVTITNAAEAGEAEEMGGIAGVWMDSNSGDVTFTNCEFTGTLTANFMEGVDLSDNTLTGKAYYGNGAGKLIIDGSIVVTSDASLDAVISGGSDTIVLGSGNYIIPDSAKGKTLEFIGNGNTVVATQDDGSYEGCDYSLDGATVTFKNIKITTDSSTYTGYARLKATYEYCVINGTYTLYDNSVFKNCTFNVEGDVYNIWTWGAPIATFENCTFNSDGKALLLYGTADTKLTLIGCTFNDNGGLADLKAAVEIGNDYGRSYELIVTNTVVNGYEINDKGINTGTTLWGNKNSMGTDKLNVVVDGVDVY